MPCLCTARLLSLCALTMRRGTCPTLLPTATTATTPSTAATATTRSTAATATTSSRRQRRRHPRTAAPATTSIDGDNGDDHLTGGAGDDLHRRRQRLRHRLLFRDRSANIRSSRRPAICTSSISAAPGADGHDQLISVERLVFADRVIDIGSGNNAPVAVDDHVSINEDTGTYSSGAASVLDNDFDFDGDALTVTGGTFVGTYGTLTLNANGTYSYTLIASAQGLDDGEIVTDSFNYTVSDNDGSDTGTLIVPHRRRSTTRRSPTTTPPRPPRTPPSPATCSPTTPTSTSSR